MKPTRINIFSLMASLILAGLFVCWETGLNCGPLLPLKNGAGETMGKINPPFKGTSDSQHREIPCSEKPGSRAKRHVFLNGRRLYWGNLGDLTKPEKFFVPRSFLKTTGAENVVSIKHEALQHFTQELRSALKAFEQRYCLKINWRKKDLKMLDVTTQFINFWDKELGHERKKTPEETEETGDTEGKEQ